MNAAIRDYARKLGITDSQLRRLERRYRYGHGDEAEAKLTSYLTNLWAECRDRHRYMHLKVRQDPLATTIMSTQDVPTSPPEPERIPADLEDEYARQAKVVFGVVKGEEQARREARSRAERLRQAELELRQSGRSADQHAKTVDDAIAAMRREARAA
jgi:hypothetical protein